VNRVDDELRRGGDSGAADLADLLVELAGLPDDASNLDGCLRLIARRVADTVAGVNYASVTSRRGGRPTTVAMSSDVALEVDSSQYAGGGPCLEALDGQPVAVPDIAADMQWPDFRRAATQLGLHMSLSIPMVTASGETTNVLNLYSHDAGALVPLAMEVIPLFHPDVERPRTRNWGELLDDGGRLLVIGIQRALAAHDLIQTAIGVLMGGEHVDARQAYLSLRMQSAATGESIPLVAERILGTSSYGSESESGPHTTQS
jgi:hypothetical protein